MRRDRDLDDNGMRASIFRNQGPDRRTCIFKRHRLIPGTGNEQKKKQTKRQHEQCSAEAPGEAPESIAVVMSARAHFHHRTLAARSRQPQMAPGEGADRVGSVS